MTPRTRAAVRALAAMTTALAVTLAAAGCTDPAPVGIPESADVPPATAAPTPDLEAYYTQALVWKRCQSFECADLRVPIDYSDPASGDITLKLLRVKARDQDDRIGSLVVNPGGPGASGIAYAKGADRIVGAPVRKYFDVVGFDPRGVGRSEPVDCLGDGELDRFLGTDPTPDDDAEQQDLLGEAKAMASGCEARSPKLLPHVSTADAAKDLDVLRAALGDRQLNYLGKSYGTFLGSTYAEIFPERVGRFVLDGVVPPDLTSAELAEGQARGFELATRTYVQDCIDQGDCILGDSVDAGMKWIRDFLQQVDREPLPTGDPVVPELNEAWASLGLGAALYDQGTWGFLTDALAEARSGSGASLLALANTYAHREPEGGYRDNIMEAIFAVNCLDRPDSPDVATYAANAKAFSKVAPTWGGFLAWGSLPCAVWPIESTDKPHTIAAKGSSTIVVVGTTRDPATIYEWSKRLRDQLSNAVLVSYDGDGHTAYKRSNACVDKTLDSWYVQGKVPQDGLTC